jgi:hypothetical protein
VVEHQNILIQYLPSRVEELGLSTLTRVAGGSIPLPSTRSHLLTAKILRCLRRNGGSIPLETVTD